MSDHHEADSGPPPPRRDEDPRTGVRDGGPVIERRDESAREPAHQEEYLERQEHGNQDR
jgi:hypothetical protein